MPRCDWLQKLLRPRGKAAVASKVWHSQVATRNSQAATWRPSLLDIKPGYPAACLPKAQRKAGGQAAFTGSSSANQARNLWLCSSSRPSDGQRQHARLTTGGSSKFPWVEGWEARRYCSCRSLGHFGLGGLGECPMAITGKVYGQTLPNRAANPPAPSSRSLERALQAGDAASALRDESAVRTTRVRKACRKGRSCTMAVASSCIAC